MIRIMPGITRKATAIALAAGAMLAANAGVMTASASAASQYGCPRGAVCIYPQGKGINGGHPSNVYYAYGPHRLYNQYGNHAIVNNQWGGAGYRLCTGYNGAGCGTTFGFGLRSTNGLTPINSIVLTRPRPCQLNRCPV